MVILNNTLTINETIYSLDLLVWNIRKHLHYWLQNHIHVTKQWGLHSVQVHQGDCSQQKPRFTHWQKWKRSPTPSSICTCKLLAFSCNVEIAQMVIIQRKTFAFCKKLHHWESSDLIFAWLSFLLWHVDRESWKKCLLSQQNRVEISC